MKKEGVTILSLIVNVFLASAKLFIGLLSMSSAIIAEGIHSGMDIVTSGISYIGIRAGKKPKDREHPYGHYKSESISGFVITIVLFISALYIIYEAVLDFLGPKTLEVSYLMLVLMAVSAFVNLLMSSLKMKYGKKHESMALIADASHSRMDVFTSAGVFAGLVFSVYWVYADSLIAILIGLYILRGSIKLGKKTTDSLLGVSAGREVENRIREIADGFKVEISDIRTQKLGAEIFAELIVKLESKLKVEDATAITKGLEKRLMESVPGLKYVVIQIESHDVRESYYKRRIGSGMRWRGSMGGVGMGPGGECICPECGNKVPHQRGIPCFKRKCKKCGSMMIRKR